MRCHAGAPPGLVVLAAIAGSFACATAGRSQEADRPPASQPPASSASHSLRDLIDLALERNAGLVEGRWRVAGAAARLKKARAASFLPRLRLESVSGLVPDAKGDALEVISDTTGLRPLGLFNQTELEFAQPLYTFGYLSQLQKAAAAGVEVEEASLEERRLDVTLEIKELYYALLLAQDLRDLARRLSEELEEKRDEVDEDDPAVPLSAPYRLELTLLELRQRRRQIDDELSLAREALAWKAGLPESDSLDLEATLLEPEEAHVPALDTLLETALVKRPEWQQLVSGIRAKKALRSASRSAYYPQVFLGGGVRFARAPNRTDQHNPFVKDDFNFFNGGFFLGLRQSFEWGMLSADEDKARAELFELKAKESAAAQGIRLDVRRAYGKFERGSSGLEDAVEARQLTRTWLGLARDEYEFDPAEVKELIRAFEAFAAAEQAYFQSIFEYNMSLAALERAVGTSLSTRSGGVK